MPIWWAFPWGSFWVKPGRAASSLRCGCAPRRKRCWSRARRSSRPSTNCLTRPRRCSKVTHTLIDPYKVGDTHFFYSQNTETTEGGWTKILDYHRTTEKSVAASVILWCGDGPPTNSVLLC